MNRIIANVGRVMTLLVIVISAAQPESAAAQRTKVATPLRLIDSVTVTEGGELVLSRPVALIVGPRGEYYVADAGEGRIYEISRSGTIVRAFGKKGRGPGELQSPGSIALSGDSILAVMDDGERRVTLYNRSTGTFKSSFVLIGWQPTLQFSGPILLAASVNADSGFSLLRIGLNGDRLSSEGIVPSVLRQYPLLQSAVGHVVLDEANGNVLAVFEASQSAFRWREGARNADELLIPTVSRKGVRASLFEDLMRDPSKASTLLFDRSVPQHLAFMSSSRVALITVDGRMAGRSFVGAQVLTVIDLARSSACPDLAIPIPEDPLPRVTVRGDTVIALQQMGKPTGEVTAAIKRFHVSTDGCDWKPVKLKAFPAR